MTTATSPSPGYTPGTAADGALDAAMDVAMDAATACYLRQGVARTTANDIAREAGDTGVTRPSSWPC
jgi:AcrR family transcriptional regulator